MAGVPEWVLKVSADYSTDRFHVNFDGYKYNHMYQGIIALWHLGANEAQARQFAELCTKNLEPARIGKDEKIPTHQLLSEAELKDLLGKRQKYHYLLAHYRKRLVDLGGDFDLLINADFPALVTSVAASALHGIIQLGYGYNVKDERLFCEGLAYLHYQYLPHKVSSLDKLAACLGAGNTDILEVLRELREGSLRTYMENNTISFNNDRDGSHFLRRLHTVLLEKGDDIIEMVGKVKMPEWFDKDNLNVEQLTKIANWIIDCAIIVYGASDRVNDFFILHGVTGAWAFGQILPRMTDKTQALQAITYFISGVFATFMSVGCPGLDMKTLTSVDAVGGWDAIISKCMEAKSNEHVYKLVHVCQTRAQDNASDKVMTDIYMKASYLATFRSFSFVSM